MPYSSSESATYLSLVPVDVRSMMDVDSPSMSTYHMCPQKMDDSA